MHHHITCLSTVIIIIFPKLLLSSISLTTQHQWITDSFIIIIIIIFIFIFIFIFIIFTIQSSLLMDTPSPPPTTTTATTATTDDQIHPTTTTTTTTLIPKQLPPPFTNGVLKRHKLRHHHHPPPVVVVAYKECLKNHAASIGGHAVDGCGEFMPSPAATPADPTSIKCAACGCHRNFHRRDTDASFPINPSPPVQHVIDYQPHHRHHPPPPQPPPPQPISVAGVMETSVSPPDSPSPPPISSSYMLLALSSGLSAPPPEITHNPQISTGVGANSTGKKRFRTKFTQDQKQKMHELAERVGWKMQKKDEDLIINFCNEIGVDKGVFKVWMHNNKMTFAGKKDSGHQLVDSGSSGGGGGGGGDFFMSRNYHHLQQQQNNDSGSSGGGGGGGGGDGGGDVITNGSSSSS